MNNKTVLLGELNLTQQELIYGLLERYPAPVGSEDKGMPLFAKVGEEAHFISDVLLPSKANKEFEKIGADNDLYRGGAGVLVRTANGTVAAPDERSNWFKPIPIGISTGASEGEDLIGTARRELGEELFVIILDEDKKHGARICPIGLEGLDLFSPALNVQASRIENFGELILLERYFNTANSAFEEIYEWDITSLDPSTYTIVCQEEWFRGGNSGIILFVLLKDGKPNGAFSGQQGLVPFVNYGLHPAFVNDANR